jgi:hypothetical protein
MADLKFRIELNVLNHLGIGLYSSTPAVVSEVISNAWDADAVEVKIQLKSDEDEIIVDDDGHGMTEDAVLNKFLKVGYTRRLREKNKSMSQSGKRRVMGRKGIGKLAMFSLANSIEVVTKAEGTDAVAFKIDVKKLKAMTSGSEDAVDYPVERIDVPADFTKPMGTRIRLTDLNSKINKTEEYLRPRLARRFGVFADTFKVELNGKALTRSEASLYKDLQFLWFFDTVARDEVLKIAPAIATRTDEDGNIEHFAASLPAILNVGGVDVAVKGFIGTVDTPSKLGRGDESLNKVSIFANGRLFQEDILSELGDARYFNNYIFGEVQADFLDSDDTDRATASREAIKHDDAHFQALRSHLVTVMRQIRDEWDDWRRELGYTKTATPNPNIVEWLDSFTDPRDRKAADRIMTSIGNVSVSNDPIQNQEAQRLLYRSAIVGFEKLRARQRLDELDKITDVLSPEFQAIFATLNDIEESYYLDITKQRLEIIRKFDVEIVDARKLEKVAQKYLFDHLWLLDPSWDRVKGTEAMEVTMTAELKRACPEAEVGARLDIAYRTTAGAHIIIELKRPGLTLKMTDLEMQARKYVEAMEQYYRDHPDFLAKLGGRVPGIQIFLLISTAPPISQKQQEALNAYNIKILTYKGLIESAKASYQNYFDVKTTVGKLETILSKL